MPEVSQYCFAPAPELVEIEHSAEFALSVEVIEQQRRQRADPRVVDAAISMCALRETNRRNTSKSANEAVEESEQ